MQFNLVIAPCLAAAKEILSYCRKRGLLQIIGLSPTEKREYKRYYSIN